MTQDAETLSRYWGAEFTDDIPALHMMVRQPRRPPAPEPRRVYLYHEVLARLSLDAPPRHSQVVA